MTKSCAAQAVWFSASADLAVDATRDFRDIGAYKYDPIRIHDLRKVGKPPTGQKLEDIKVISWRSIPKSPLIHLFIVLWPKKIAHQQTQPTQGLPTASCNAAKQTKCRGRLRWRRCPVRLPSQMRLNWVLRRWW